MSSQEVFNNSEALFLTTATPAIPSTCSTPAPETSDINSQTSADATEADVSTTHANSQMNANEAEEDVPAEPTVLGERENNPKRVYIITYSQAQRSIFAKREHFGKACVAAFGGNMVKYFSVSEEPHQDGGFHYHVAILLTKSARWKTARKYLKETYNVDVHFSSSPAGQEFYDGAYCYITKFDKNFYHGYVTEAHPKRDELLAGSKRRSILKNATATSTSNARQRKSEKAASKEVATKKKKIDRLDVIDFILEHEIKDDDTFLMLVEKRRVELGDREMALMSAKLGEKGRGDIMRDAWKMRNAPGEVMLKSKSRLDIIREVISKGECECDTRGKWLALAMDVCDKNNMDWKMVSNAFYELLEKGRGKHRNILITGERNCAKTFLLEPLGKVFVNTFHSPAGGNFGWVGADTKQIIYLNDFRWKPNGCIAFDELLRLLEGHNCTLAAPMNSCTKHVEITAKNDVPIFCTSKTPIRFYNHEENEPQTRDHDMENRMMETRWKHIELKHVFEEKDKVECEPCAFCFCHFIKPSSSC